MGIQVHFINYCKKRKAQIVSKLHFDMFASTDVKIKLSSFDSKTHLDSSIQEQYTFLKLEPVFAKFKNWTVPQKFSTIL